MKRKKMITLFAGSALCLSLLAGCGGKDAQTGSVPAETTVSSDAETAQAAETAESIGSAETGTQEAPSTDPLEMITQGRYIYSYPVDGLGDFTYFFHFYEEEPVIGSVYYAGFALNQINFTGTYQVEEKEYEYHCYATRADAEAAGEGTEPPAGTAPYTITFYDWEGNEMDSCGFDGEILYHDMENIKAVGGGNAYYVHDTDGADSKFAETYEGEVGQAYLDFVGEEDATSTLTLYHNGTYMDLVNMMVEGSWSMEETTDGYTYTLTPESDADTAAVLAVASDRLTASYTPDGGEAVSMVNTSEAGPKVFQTMAGKVPIPGQEIEADVTVVLYNDETCKVSAAAFGQEIPLDEGTYSMGDNGFTITFVFDAAGEVVSALEAESGQVSIQYVQAGTQLGDLDVTLSIVTE